MIAYCVTCGWACGSMAGIMSPIHRDRNHVHKEAPSEEEQKNMGRFSPWIKPRKPYKAKNRK